MRFKRHAKLEHGLQQIDIAPLINIVFLLIIFFILSSTFVYQAGIKVKLPRAITSEAIKEENLTIVITGEGVIYLNNAIVTIKELKKEFSKPSNRGRPVLIKANRRASLGRIIDIWDLARDLGIERINIATDQEK